MIFSNHKEGKEDKELTMPVDHLRFILNVLFDFYLIPNDLTRNITMSRPIANISMYPNIDITPYAIKLSNFNSIAEHFSINYECFGG